MARRASRRAPGSAPALALPYALLVAGLVGAGLWQLWREGDDRWLLYAVAIGVAPLLGLGLLDPQVVAVRYFLIGIAFSLLLLAAAAARAVSSSAA